MDEQQVRGIVREVIARQLGHAALSPATPMLARSHASHLLLRVTAGTDHGGPCLIEPATACDHCGYCKSLGH